MYLTPEFTRKMFRLGFFLVIILVLLDLLTYFQYPDHKISEIFLATREQTPLTWVSAVVLLLIAFSSASSYLETKDSIWYFITIIFLFLSMDDATYFHERFSGFIQETYPIFASFPSYSWIIMYLPILLFGLGSLVYLLFKELDSNSKKYLLLAVILLGISLFLDMIDGWVGKSNMLVFCYDPSCSSVTEHLFRLTEEVLEIFGLGVIALLNIRTHSLKG